MSEGVTDLCLFCHYSELNKIPNYVIYYLEQLSEITDKIIVLTNERDGDITNLSVLKDMGIEYRFYKNEGYDFGMYYKFIMNEDFECKRLWLVNDSMVTFNSLSKIGEWVNKQNKEYLGISDSIQKSYHLQSYFLVLNRRVQELLKRYMEMKGIVKSFNEVVDVYEIGFSTFLIDKDVRFAAYKGYDKVYMDSLKINGPVYYPESYIKSGVSMIKKKVLFNTFTKSEKVTLMNTSYDFKEDYMGMIKKYMSKFINIKYLTKEYRDKKG